MHPDDVSEEESDKRSDDDDKDDGTTKITLADLLSNEAVPIE